MGDLINALDMGNNMPGGTVEATAENNYKEVIVRTLGEYDPRKEDIENTVLRANVFAEPIFALRMSLR